jgi:hypothetical protein
MTGTRCTCGVPRCESPLRTHFCMRTLSILFGSPDAHAACVRAREYLHLVELFIEPPELLLQPRNVQFLIAAQSAMMRRAWRRLGARAVYKRRARATKGGSLQQTAREHRLQQRAWAHHGRTSSRAVGARGAWCGASFTAGDDDWREDKSMVVEALEVTMLVDVLEAAGDLNIPVAHHSACQEQVRRNVVSLIRSRKMWCTVEPLVRRQRAYETPRMG